MGLAFAAYRLLACARFGGTQGSVREPPQVRFAGRAPIRARSHATPQSGAAPAGSAVSLPAESRTRAPGGGLSWSVRGGKAPASPCGPPIPRRCGAGFAAARPGCNGWLLIRRQSAQRQHAHILLRLEANRPRNLFSIIQILPNQKTELRKSLILSGLGRSTHLVQYIVRRYDRIQKSRSLCG